MNSIVKKEAAAGEDAAGRSAGLAGQTAAAAMAVGCSRCGLCRNDCAFLQCHGLPGEIAAEYGHDPEACHDLAFSCSLCGLCTAVCPEALDPSRMFLAFRREKCAQGDLDLSDHRRLLAYERRGTSRRYSWYRLPENCDTVFFPGCTLPGTRPTQTIGLYRRLQAMDAAMGIVLDCCTKPSHDLGRQEYFLTMFSELHAYLLAAGVRTVICACPNCYRVFSEYGEQLQVMTVYEFLAQRSRKAPASLIGEVSVHDPCVLRQYPGIHAAVRQLVTDQGVTIEEMVHSREKTLCCGEGGAVGCISDEFPRAWALRRKKETGNHRIITYCAGCAATLGRWTPTSHLVDLLLAPEQTLTGKVRVSKAPFTYLNRLRLKKQLKREAGQGDTIRERTCGAAREGRSRLWPRITVLAVLAAVVVGMRAAGLMQYVDQERLRTLLASWGQLGPIVYMAIYTLAPSLFLPGLPLTIAGGVLFGPFWGVVYTITGATAGACLAFCISRYVAGDWISLRLTGPRWSSLHRHVEQHGWKVVAFTRLVPLFPFNLLNYAFGLTRIRFLDYALATALCMLPGCIAFIVFSSSLLDLLQGKVSRGCVIGAALIVLVSLAPVVYRRFWAADTGDLS